MPCAISDLRPPWSSLPLESGCGTFLPRRSPMHSLKFNFARIAFACLLLTVGFASTASAVQSQFQILLNLDNNISTGCDVPTLTGTFPGAEQILITTVNTTGSSAAVTAVETRTCVNPATDTF